MEPSSKTQTNEPYDETPVWVRGNENEGFYATIGDYRLTKAHKTVEEILERLNETDLRLIVSLISAMIEIRIQTGAMNIEELLKQVHEFEQIRNQGTTTEEHKPEHADDY